MSQLISQTTLFILPLKKIAHKAYPTNIPGPCSVRVHHCVIEPNGKEDQGFWGLAFSLKGQFHLSLDPITFDSMFGENQQQFVLPLDGLVDLGAHLVTDSEIMGRKLAGDTLALQISMQLFGKCLIFGGITQDTGVIVRRYGLRLSGDWKRRLKRYGLLGSRRGRMTWMHLFNGRPNGCGNIPKRLVTVGPRCHW